MNEGTVRKDAGTVDQMPRAGGKLTSLEGLRAYACLVVFLTHFCGSLCNRFAWYRFAKASVPFRLLFRGNPVVQLLFALSAFVLSYKYLRVGAFEGERRASSLMGDSVKRYFRLYFPGAVMCLAAYLLMVKGLMFNLEASKSLDPYLGLGKYYSFEPDFIKCLWESVSLLFVHYKTKLMYDGPLWTQQFEFLGSLLVFAILSLLRTRRIRYVFYVLFLILMEGYFCCFIAGMFAAELYCDERFFLNAWMEKYPRLTSLGYALAFLLMAYAPGTTHSRKYHFVYYIYLIGLLNLSLHASGLRKLWENRLVQWFAEQSFGVYIVHWPLIASFSCWFYLKFQASMSLGALIALDGSLSFVLTLFFSVLMTRFVIRPSGNWSKKIAGLLIGTEDEKKK